MALLVCRSRGTLPYQCVCKQAKWIQNSPLRDKTLSGAVDPIIQCYHRLSNATVVLLLFFISWFFPCYRKEIFLSFFSFSCFCSHTLFLRFKPLGNACLRLYGCRDRVEGFLCFSLSDALLQDTGGPSQLARVSQPTHPSSSGHTHAVIGFCWSFFHPLIYMRPWR